MLAKALFRHQRLRSAKPALTLTTCWCCGHINNSNCTCPIIRGREGDNLQRVFRTCVQLCCGQGERELISAYQSYKTAVMLVLSHKLRHILQPPARLHQQGMLAVVWSVGSWSTIRGHLPTICGSYISIKSSCKGFSKPDRGADEP